eukprot:m.413452 g.413452  ORF g.413452 m.413452 type:complete len:148 (+) comp29102_c0_seq1:35-478(+)
MTMFLERDPTKVMVDKSDEKDVPILKEDQESINKFARFSNQVQSLEGELEHKQTEMENIKDALASVEEFGITAEEDDKLRLSVGECFIEVSTDVAEERLAGMTTQAEADVTAINAEIAGCKKEMEGLKVILYAKFGKTINLEMDPEE